MTQNATLAEPGRSIAKEGEDSIIESDYLMEWVLEALAHLRPFWCENYIGAVRAKSVNLQ